MDDVPSQADSRQASLSDIVWHAAFRRGVTEVRNGRHPRFDDDDAFHDGVAWVYEWGRQFAVLAPPDLPLVLPDEGALNPKAVELFRSFVSRGEICP
jgi:hypothetical protein